MVQYSYPVQLQDNGPQILTDESFNDGLWHYLVAKKSSLNDLSNCVELLVDGIAVYGSRWCLMDLG